MATEMQAQSKFEQPSSISDALGWLNEGWSADPRMTCGRAVWRLVAAGLSGDPAPAARWAADLFDRCAVRAMDPTGFRRGAMALAAGMTSKQAIRAINRPRHYGTAQSVWDVKRLASRYVMDMLAADYGVVPAAEGSGFCFASV